MCDILIKPYDFVYKTIIKYFGVYFLFRHVQRLSRLSQVHVIWNRVEPKTPHQIVLFWIIIPVWNDPFLEADIRYTYRNRCKIQLCLWRAIFKGLKNEIAIKYGNKSSLYTWSGYGNDRYSILQRERQRERKRGSYATRNICLYPTSFILFITILIM